MSEEACACSSGRWLLKTGSPFSPQAPRLDRARCPQYRSGGLYCRLSFQKSPGGPASGQLVQGSDCPPSRCENLFSVGEPNASCFAGALYCLFCLCSWLKMTAPVWMSPGAESETTGAACCDPEDQKTIKDMHISTPCIARSRHRVRRCKVAACPQGVDVFSLGRDELGNVFMGREASE